MLVRLGPHQRLQAALVSTSGIRERYKGKHCWGRRRIQQGSCLHVSCDLVWLAVETYCAPLALIFATAPYLCAELHEHMVALRVAGEQDHARNRARIASQGRNGRKAKTFCVGDNVLLVPQKCGHAGGATIDPQSIVCRVVGVHRPGSHTKYKLRCNSGMLEGLFFPSQIRVAPQLSAATLTFTGVDTKDVRPVSLAGTKAQQRVGGAAAAPCRCRGKCTSRCKCKGSCSRACGCNGFCNGRH